MADESEAKVDIVIESIKIQVGILELKPNDIIVVSVPHELFQAEIDKMKNRIQRDLKEQHNIPNKVIVLASGAQIGLIRQL